MATTGSAVAASVITSSQIKDGTIQTKDISSKARNSLKGKAGKTGPAGPQGNQGQIGPRGLTGASGATNVKVRVAFDNVTAGGENSIFPACHAGERATGAGAFFVGGPLPGDAITELQPGSVSGEALDGDTPVGYAVGVHNGGAVTRVARAYVICAAP